MAISKTFKVDAAMLLFFVITAVSGVEFHFEHHGSNVNLIHLLFWMHTICSALFFVMAVMHVKLHWGWYRSLFKADGKRKIVTTTLSLIFVLVVVTAVLKLAGMHRPIGMIHYFGGLLLTLFVAIHFVKRIRTFIRGILGK